MKMASKLNIVYCSLILLFISVVLFFLLQIIDVFKINAISILSLKNHSTQIVLIVMVPMLFAILLFISWQIDSQFKKKVQYVDMKIENEKLISASKQNQLLQYTQYINKLQQIKMLHKMTPLPSSLTSFTHFNYNKPGNNSFFFQFANTKFVYAAIAYCNPLGLQSSLMSSHVYLQLQKMVNSNGKPHDILNQINNETKTTFQKLDDVESSYDNLNIALCRLELENNMLVYAGQNIPLLLSINNESSIRVIQDSDNLKDSSTKNKDHLKSYEFKLEENDSLYLYANNNMQCQGLLALLENTKYLDLKVQEAFLNNYFLSNTKNDDGDSLVMIRIKI